MELTTSILSSGIALGVVIGLTEVVKRLGINEKLLPVVALIFGEVFTLSTVGLTQTGVWTGIILGLASSGLWSSVKHTFK